MDDSNAFTAAHLRDFRLAIEFKYLMKHAPGGVFLMPEFDDIRQLNGVIFVRRGLYRNGIFRFKISLPRNYNSVNAHPLIIFTPPIFNPLIDNETGILDLRLEESLREWQPDKHFIVTVLTFLKKIFYMQNFQKYPSVPNETARNIFTNDKEEYLRLVEECVQDSLKRIHETFPNNTIIFTEPKPAHDLKRKQIYAREIEEAGSSSASRPGGENGNSRPEVLYDRSNEAEDAAEREESNRNGLTI
eukprot:gene7623-15611_t